MKSDRIFGNTLAMLERSLDMRSRNQKLIVSNLANLDTPNYKAFKTMVADQMAGHAGGQAQVTMTRTSAGHMAPRHTNGDAAVPAERIEHNPLSMRGDGNTVELEREMSHLAENTLMYNTATRLVANKFNLLKSIIKGGS